ncbi:aminodeoxychorismate synthase component I [Microbacterium immunditiarum]|uniref:Anthranilate synthase component 1 n=1 Tax=Microbacterium immunditiarum TaxID=337480 RepID=A0A7Y9GQA4_9MICO|nr:anthranilate synthase component 1 [Microbacterium immunditiarum]
MSKEYPAVPLDAWVDPEAVFCALADGDADVFWLDAGPTASSGWSFLGTGRREERLDSVRDVPLGGPRPGRDDVAPFRGGWVGWLSYEDAAARAGAPAAEPDPVVPRAAWLRADSFLAFDHATRRAWAVGEETDAAALAALARSAGAPHPVRPAPTAVQASARHLPDEYAGLVERCRDHIREGDAYQLCLTTRFSLDRPVDAVAAYRRLRSATPSHHGGFIRAGGVALASASPEQFLEVEDGIVRTKPIKGTRPRGVTPDDDVALAAELRANEKERAENVMIVDLMRNDLSRVCEPGSVGVDGLLEVESYPAVHQLVSTVSGRLLSGTTLGGLLDAAFPAGSMTGAPKLSAMTILHELERGPRGVFSGCFGWVGDDGALDLAMVIRSIVAHSGGAYVGAGGGITWRSEPPAEVAEVGIKARAPLAAIGATLPPGW